MPAPLAGLLARVGARGILLGDKGGSGGGVRSNSGMRVSVSVRDGVSEPLKKAGVLIEQRTKQVIQRATFHVRNTVVDSIMRESKTGRTYKRGSVTHQASAEGEAPASNTGFLVNNVYQQITKNGLTGIVESRAGYSAFLEYGTQKMGARPYMFPALEKTRQKFFKDIKGIV